MATRTRTQVDRAALLRRSLLELVAERGFRGTSMSAVAERAGVAAGTAYVHYDSKDELIVATYVEIKLALGHAAVVGIPPDGSAHDRFVKVWYNIHDFLAADPAQARYLAQLEASPYFERAYRQLAEMDDPLLAAAAELKAVAIDLPVAVLWDLAVGPAIRLAADASTTLTANQRTELAEACWRALRKPD
ncbi:MAG: helix-turn-helix domain-containing protein [Chloroflexota bacterium]